MARRRGDRSSFGESLHALDDMARGERAFRGDIGLVRLGRRARHRLAGRHGGLEIIHHHAPGTAVALTALDDLDVRIGYQRQHIARLGADVLRPGMAGEMQRHAAAEGG